MTYFSPAKLNLFLHITGKRADGYHDLQSVFCTLDFGDFLAIELVAKPLDATPLIHLTGADTLTDNLADNLIYKAVHALSDRYPAHAKPLSIHLDKRIPTGAGLGGGSSNCATTLLAVNELWGLHLPTDELIKIGATLGADVPFFIFAHAHQSSAIVEGIGDRLTALDLPACEFLLLLPDAHISTAQFFAMPNLNRACPTISHDDLRQMDFYQLPSHISNVFEPLAVADSPQVAAALAYLNTLEPCTHTTARMTGTGAVVFLPLLGIDDSTKTLWATHAPCPALTAKLLF